MVHLLTHREHFERMLRECPRELHVATKPGSNGSVTISVAQGYHEGCAFFEFDKNGKRIGVGGSDEGVVP